MFCHNMYSEQVSGSYHHQIYHQVCSVLMCRTYAKGLDVDPSRENDRICHLLPGVNGFSGKDIVDKVKEISEFHQFVSAAAPNT